MNGRKWRASRAAQRCALCARGRVSWAAPGLNRGWRCGSCACFISRPDSSLHRPRMPGFEGCAYAVSFSKQFDVTPVFRSSWLGSDESSVDDSSSTVLGSVSDADAAGAAIIAELNLPSQSLQAQQSAILSGCLHRQGGPFSWCAPISILSNRTRGRARSAAPPRPQQPRTAMHFAQFCCCVLLGKPLILTVACATWGKPR